MYRSCQLYNQNKGSGNSDIRAMQTVIILIANLTFIRLNDQFLNY